MKRDMFVPMTPYKLAEVFIGTKEVSGVIDNPQVMAFLKSDHDWPENDEVPWCSGFVNYICKLLRLPRSKSLLARSWLGVGEAIDIDDALIGFDVVILKRGSGDQPGPEDLTASGHVGFFAGLANSGIGVLGGNQSNGVNVSFYSRRRLLGIRRLHP